MADEDAPKQLSQAQLLDKLKEKHSCKIVHSQMPSSFEQDAMYVCLSGVDQYKALKDIAQYIKQEYDKKYPSNGKATDGVYHCIVGKSFASKCLLDHCKFSELEFYCALITPHHTCTLPASSSLPSSQPRLITPSPTPFPAGGISHETRQCILLKVDVYHVLLWKSKDSPFHASDA